MGLLDATESDSFLTRWAARLLIMILAWLVIGGGVWLAFALSIGHARR